MIPLLRGAEGGVTLLAAYNSHNTPLLPQCLSRPLSRGELENLAKNSFKQSCSIPRTNFLSECTGQTSKKLPHMRFHVRKYKSTLSLKKDSFTI